MFSLSLSSRPRSHAMSLPASLPLPPARTSPVSVSTGSRLNHSCSLWRSRLSFALRGALACVLIGVATVYGPAKLREFVTFPAFSYVTAVLIVGEATLGDSLHGAASSFCATLLGALPAMLTLLLAPEKGLSVAGTTLVVSLSAFVVALPESTSLITKRIALGQIVIIYVATSNQGIRFGHPQAVLHPVHVAASMAVGVAASLLASLFPYPRLASFEISNKRKVYKGIVTERLRLLVNALFADGKSSKDALISQLRSLSSAGNKILESIKLKQGSQKWERNPVKFITEPWRGAAKELQGIEASLKGMEMAVSHMTSVPVEFSDNQFKRDLINLRNLTSLGLIQNDSVEKWETAEKTLQQLLIFPQEPKDLPFFFFMFCLLHLHNRSIAPAPVVVGQERKVMPTTEPAEGSSKEEPSGTRAIRSLDLLRRISFTRERLVVASKVSLSLGFAVFFGLLFSRENGFWSGLTVATTVAPWRESTFRLANLRAQGTAVGTIYGVIGAMISQNLMELRFLVLLPWIALTSFLQRSRMYGPAGGIAAAVSAVLILGRRNYGPPSAFAIARLTETFIGLLSMVTVELLLQPVRASTLARESLCRSLTLLDEFMDALVPSTSTAALKEKERSLRGEVNALKKYIREAEAEPNFWFLPFPAASYGKLCSSMFKIVDLLHFLAMSMEALGDDASDNEEHIFAGDHLGHLKKLIGPCAKSFVEVIQVKSLSRLEKECRNKASVDVESGKIDLTVHAYGSLSPDEEDCQKVVSSFLQHSKEVIEEPRENRDGEAKSKLVLCLATTGFCMQGLMTETRELEMGILELWQRENPGSHINLNAIYCKIRRLSN